MDQECSKRLESALEKLSGLIKGLVDFEDLMIFYNDIMTYENYNNMIIVGNEIDNVRKLIYEMYGKIAKELIYDPK